jgi:toxin-antitoxin system PIN domain toxin
MKTTDLPDVNVLFALHRPEYVRYEQANEWFAAATSFATCPVTELGMIRLLLNPALSDQPVPNPEFVLRMVRTLRSHAAAQFWVDDTSLAEASTVTPVLRGHQQVTDLHLLNLARAHGGRLVTFDAKLVRSVPAELHDHVTLLPA